jgi:hypothetical protein
VNAALFIGNVLVHLTTLLAWAFIVLYHLSAPWWRTEAGKHVMAFMAALAAVLTLSSLRLATGAPAQTEPVTWFTWLRVLVFASVPAVIGWRVAILWRAQYRGRRWAEIRGRRQSGQPGR